MKLLKPFALLLCFMIMPLQQAFSQCFQIESILVDACGGQEGLNEMVRFKVGNAPLNAANLSVSWPNNPWQGLTQNAMTTQKVAILNADILDAGGCGQLIEPTGGVLPANATVILVTSFNFDTSLNSFGALTENIYILFQDNPNTSSGHFANSGAGVRTLTLTFGSCSDTVSYDRALLIDPNGNTVAADGAIVLFDAANTPTYINNGCSAPVPPFTVDAGTSITACPGTTINLNGIAQGQQTVLWSAASGSFSNSTGLSTSYTIGANVTGSITLTLTATNSCGATISDTVTINIGGNLIPNFPTTLTICNGATAPTLNTSSPNGITGTWNPSTISNTTSGNYVFTPNAGQCASNVTLQVMVTNGIIPNFATTLTLCTGNTAPTLNTSSPNGITGIWNPSTISNTTTGNYVFTPNAGQCASNVTLQVTVTNSIIPNFATTLTLCTGSTAPTLNTSSPNGISGTWNPSTISNTTSGNYIFTPNAGQCASNVTLQVTVTNSIIPNFATTLTLCTGSTPPTLNTSSPNGISGTWNPSTINNTTSGNYVFTPNAGQCAANITLQVEIETLDVKIAETCAQGDIVLTVIGISEAATFEWKDQSGNVVGDHATLNITDLTINTSNPVLPQSYEVFVTTSGNCAANKSFTVYSLSCAIPKGISPNGDSKNDQFDLSGLGVKELSIFNRYGLKVYSLRNYTNQWNGQTDNGRDLPDGTYYYVVTLIDKVKTGWVYLNRQQQ